MNRLNHPGRRKQSGIALVVVLLLLLVITVLGLAAMRGTIMQERMSGNTNARAIAFQAAEAVLREAEAYAQGALVIPASGCSNGVCAQPPVTGAAPWEDPAFWTTSGAGYRVANIETTLGRDDLLARYVIEDMGLGMGVLDDCPSDIDMSAPSCGGGGTDAKNYRITAYARLENGAEVTLQSGFKVP